MMNLLLTIIFAYLLGAIPTGYLFGKMLKGIDIREHGSGNMGATNVFRVLGKGPGAVCLILDILKGVIATTLVPNVFGVTGVISFIILAVVAVAGHNWTCFLKFKGGKGVATSLGVLIGLTIQVSALQPVVGLIVLTWIVVFLLTGYVSLASICAAIALPLLMLIVQVPLPLIILGFLFSFFVIYRHQANITRLRAGIENKVYLFGKKNKE